jgi:hypothetical protein
MRLLKVQYCETLWKSIQALDRLHHPVKQLFRRTRGM